MVSRVLSGILLAATIGSFISPVHAAGASRDETFFNRLDGKWRGPGEIVAGKYKGTKFVCDFVGATPNGTVGMSLDGDCRVGMFTQKMQASVKRSGKGYKGTFLDGALGEGLDVVNGNVSKDRVVLTLKRKELNGAMLARMEGENQLNITVSVRVNSELVPVIGMKLDRIDAVKVGSVK